MKHKIKKIPTDQPALNLDARLSLILALGLVVVPHISRLPVWLSLFASAVLVFSLAGLRNARLRAPKFLVFLLSFLLLGGVLLHYSTLFGLDSGVCVMIGMLFLKLLETRSHRDAMVMLTLNHFVIITNFLYEQSIPGAMYMLVVVVVSAAAFISINAGPNSISWKEKLRLATPMCLFALPLMVLLFMLLPRIPGPLWGIPKDMYSARSGLSDTMSPNSVSELALSDEVVFRVKFHGQLPSNDQLYWRAIVLSDFDGRSWRGGFVRRKQKAEIITHGDPYYYTVTLEPHHKRWLFALEMPQLAEKHREPSGTKFLLTSTGQIISSHNIINLTAYSMTSYPDYQLDTKLDDHTRHITLGIPPYNPDSLALARSWRADNADVWTIVNKALNMFRSDFTYTLRPGRTLGINAVDEFLFETKRGFCEHFASAFALLMRAAGIPSRVVTGYQGGELNPMGDYLLIRQADAHAWVEIWIDDQGWVRVDPTQAVAPSRIDLGLDEAIPAAENPRFLLRNNYQIMKRLRLVWDSINNRWNRWVLGYDPDTQSLILKYLGIQNATAYKLVLLLTVALAISLTIIVLISLKKAKPARRDAPQQLYLALCKKLQKAGYTRQVFQGPESFLRDIAKQNAPLAKQMKPAFQLYVKLRYQQTSSDHDLKKLRQTIRQFKVADLHKASSTAY